MAAISAPGSPTGLVAVPGDARVTLTWAAPTSNGGAAISDYVVQVSSNNGATWRPFADGVSTATAATVTGLTNGVRYVFRVAAVNVAGTGAVSVASTAILPRTMTTLPGYGVATSAVFYFSGGGWAGWSVPAGKVVLGAKIISPGDSIADFAVFKAVGPGEVFPHYSYGPAEYGWVMQAKQPNEGVQIEVYYADPPTIDVQVSPASVAEDSAEKLTYTFTASAVTATPITVNYHQLTSDRPATEGVDFTGLPPGGGVRSITIPAGSTSPVTLSSAATLAITPTPDTVVEFDETVVISLLPGTGYTFDTTRPPATGTILDDDYLVDIDVDSNNDGRIGEDDDPIEDIDAGDNANVGARIFQNIDDDNRNAAADKADGQFEPGVEDLDLTEASLSTSGLRALNNNPQQNAGNYRLWLGVPAGLNVFADRRRTPLTPDGTDGTWRYWNVAKNGSSTFPKKVFIEGLVIGEHEVIWQLCEPSVPGQNGPPQAVTPPDVVDLSVEEMVFPTIDQRRNDNDEDWTSKNTSGWYGFVLKENYPWIIEKPLVDFIKAKAPVGWLDTTLKQPQPPDNANAPSLESRQTANNDSFTIEFDYEYDRSRGENGWVAANNQQKISFVANSGVKFGGGYNTEIALLDVRAMVDRATITTNDVAYTGLNAFNPEMGKGITDAGKVVVDGLDTVREQEEIARLLTGVAYNRDFVGVTDAPDMPANGRTAANYFQVLKAVYDRAGEFEKQNGATAGGTLKASYAGATSTLTIWLNGQQTYNRNTSDEDFRPAVGEVKKLQLQSHWGSGVRFKNIRISD